MDSNAESQFYFISHCSGTPTAFGFWVILASSLPKYDLATSQHCKNYLQRSAGFSSLLCNLFITELHVCVHTHIHTFRLGKCTPVTAALGSLGQEHLQLTARLGYKWRLCLNNDSSNKKLNDHFGKKEQFQFSCSVTYEVNRFNKGFLVRKW